MKILFVLEHFYPYVGGSEKLFLELTTSLVKQGVEVIVVTTQFDANLPLEELHDGVKIVRVKCYNRFGFTFLSLWKILKYSKGCDLIHTTTYNAALPALIAGLMSRKDVIITFHEVWGKLWKRLPFTSNVHKFAFYYFEKLLLNLPYSSFVAVSEFTKQKLIEHGVAAKKIYHIYNGIEYTSLKKELNQNNEKFTYTYFGRLGISKGLDILIPAAAKFRDTYPNSSLKLIIPRQPKRMFGEVMKLINKYDLNTYIDMHHDLSNSQLRVELLNSTCVVIPSYSEGFCYAAAECVALGIPVISSQKGALKEVVSGNYIAMNEQNSDFLFVALGTAFQNKWENKPIRYFHLKDSVLKYEELYTTIIT